MDKLISIIVPIYNGEAYLEQCLDSIVNQTYKALEIILVDDGSKDNSLEICNGYAKIDSRIIVVHKDNGGVSSARNIGIKQAKGEYILFIDSDDTVELTYVEELLNANKDSKYDLVICGYKEMYTCRNIQKEYLPKNKLTGDIKEDLYKIYYFCLGPFAKLYKTDIIKRNKVSFPVEIRLGEDQVFNQLYLYYVSKYYFVNKALYNYFRRNQYSLSKSCYNKDFLDALNRLKIECQFYKEKQIAKGEMLLSKHALRIIAHFVVLEDEDSNYKNFSDRVNMVKDIVDIKSCNLPLKQKVLTYLVNKRKYLCIYLVLLLRKKWQYIIS